MTEITPFIKFRLKEQTISDHVIAHGIVHKTCNVIYSIFFYLSIGFDAVIAHILRSSHLIARDNYARAGVAGQGQSQIHEKVLHPHQQRSQ